jgi:hypothetical protein
MLMTTGDSKLCPCTVVTRRTKHQK